MSQPQPCFPLDLVLVLTGGQRDGELIPIKTQKCFLGMDDTPNSENKPQCAIFRGPNGATLRSYGNKVLVNGESKSVHWLAQGDQIQFPNSMTVQVKQLGMLPAGEEAPEVDATAEVDSPAPATAQHGNLDQETCNQLSELEAKISALQSESPAELTDVQEVADQLSITEVPAVSTRPSSPTVLNVPPEEDLPTAPVDAEGSSNNALSILESLRKEVELTESVGNSEQSISDESNQLTALNTTEPIEKIVLSNEAESLTQSVDELVPQAVEEVDVQAEVEAPQPPSSNESVAELLARMKNDGQWEGVPDDNEPVAAPAPVAEMPEPVETPDTPGTPVSESDETTVDDYMSQLLGRMRGDSPAPVPVKKAPEKKETPVEKTKPIEPVTLLKPEEFVPQQKAKRIESLSAMRELANSTARTAVHSTEVARLKALGFVQLGIAAGSLCLSGYYFGVHSDPVIGPTVGLICLGVCGFCGYRFFKTNVLSKTQAQD